MQRDQYGLHTITSLYFDTDHYDLIRTSLEKPGFKEKLRLRCYGQPAREDDVYLELKKKFDGVVYKRRISLPLRGAEGYLGSLWIQMCRQKADRAIGSPQLSSAYVQAACVPIPKPDCGDCQ